MEIIQRSCFISARKMSLRRMQRSFLLLVLFTVTMCLLLPFLFDNLGRPHEPMYANVTNQQYITCNCNDGRRLGNMMFNYASLLGIAQTNNMVPILPLDMSLRNIFEVPMGLYRAHKLGPYLDHVEYGKRGCAYDRRTKNLTSPFSYILHGYFQSYMYFQDVEDTLREHFKFLEPIRRERDQFFKDEVLPRLKQPNVVKVGIHVRRGDQANNKELVSYGYTAADAAYFSRAMEWFKDRHSDVIFIICSDDIPWSKENIPGNGVVFSENHDSSVDLAILAACDHVIISVGSFGWWAGWLANGTVTYYDKWPRPFTLLEYMVNKKEYFPPNWYPL